MLKICLLLIILFIASCGSKTELKNNNKKNVKDSTITKAPDKEYLKKRPEEFREFFALSSVLPFTGKVATKKDVNTGQAVFNLSSKGDTSHKALNIRLPFYAFLKQKGNENPKFVAVIQAESLKGDTILGYKEANGLFGICKPRELEYFESQKTQVYTTRVK